MQDAPGTQATLVTGILSVALFYIPFLGIALGIACLTYAAKAKKQFLMNSSRYLLPDSWNAGHILGIIGTALSIICTVFEIKYFFEKM